MPPRVNNTFVFPVRVHAGAYYKKDVSGGQLLTVIRHYLKP